MHSDAKLSPLLRLALKSGAIEAVTLHIRRGESPNGRDSAGLTPLMIAALHNQQESCRRLLELGADSTLRSTGGKTAGELAFDHGYLALAAILSIVPSSDAEVTAGAAPILDDNPTPEISSSAPARFGSCELMAVCADDVSADIGFSASAEDKAPLAPIAAESSLEGPTDGWLADEKVSAPVHDESCVAAARHAQILISNHRRVSDDTDWSDIEFELPEAAIGPGVILREDLNAIACVVASGLQAGYVTYGDIQRALEADCTFEMERAQEVVGRALGDLGILIEAEGAPIHFAEPCREDDELAAVIEALHDDLAEPLELSAVYGAEARKHDLIKREDEERLGRRMDSALGLLTRALAALSEQEWLLFFPKNVLGNSSCSETSEEDGEIAEESAVAEPAAEDGEIEGSKTGFREYVELVRNGAPEHGRDATVPRPTSSDLRRITEVAGSVHEATAIAVRSSISSYGTARDHLVTANLRLAISLAHGYRHRGLPLEDLIQEANIGLMRAAEGYDFRRGFKFSTYATWWIRQAVSRGVMVTARIIRVPVHQVEKINVVNRTRRELEYGREHAVSADDISNRLGLSAEQVRRIIRSDIGVVSLEECGPGREPYTPDPMNIEDPFQDSTKSSCDRSLKNAVKGMLEELDARSRDVLMARFGFDGDEGKTLEEVGQQFNVTRERIRQIEAKALRKFRHPSRQDILAPYMHVPSRITESQEEE